MPSHNIYKILLQNIINSQSTSDSVYSLFKASSTVSARAVIQIAQQLKQKIKFDTKLWNFYFEVTLDFDPPDKCLT